MFVRPTKDAPADSGSRRGESAEIDDGGRAVVWMAEQNEPARRHKTASDARPALDFMLTTRSAPAASATHEGRSYDAGSRTCLRLLPRRGLDGTARRSDDSGIDPSAHPSGRQPTRLPDQPARRSVDEPPPPAARCERGHDCHCLPHVAPPPKTPGAVRSSIAACSPARWLVRPNSAIGWRNSIFRRKK